MIMAGAMHSIISMSEKARFTMYRLDGVRRLLVFMKTYTTVKFPETEMMKAINMTKARMECQRGFIGSYWYLTEKRGVMR